MSQSRTYLAGLLVVLLSIATAVGYVTGRQTDSSKIASFLDSSTNSPTAESLIGPPTEIFVQGRLEPKDGIIHVAAIPGERIKSVEVAEGDLVEKGQRLIVLQSAQLRELERSTAELRLDEAKRKLEIEQQSAAQRVKLAELESQQLQVEQERSDVQYNGIALLEKQLEVAQDDLTRYRSLEDSKVLSPQNVRQQELLVEKLKLDVNQARSEFDAGQKALAMRSEAARANLDAAQFALQNLETSNPLGSLAAVIQVAKMQQELSQINAPSPGTVIRVLAHDGELIGNTPMLQLADLRQMVCIAEVHEADLQYLQDGQTVEITSQALPRKLTGKVELGEVPWLLGAPQLKNPDPFAFVDRRTANVRILIDPDQVDDAKFLNLQVDVRIQTKADRPPAQAAQ
jgi:ABC exporter DevB family membrane fusion protein